MGDVLFRNEANEFTGEEDVKFLTGTFVDDNLIMGWHEFYDVEYPSVESTGSMDRVVFRFAARRTHRS